MAIQLLNRNNAAGQLGAALGTGLGSGITNLLQNKLSEMERQRGIQNTKAGLQALGVSPEIANLPENLQGLAVKDILQRPQRQANLSQLQRLLGGSSEGEISGSPQNPSNLFDNHAGISSQDFNNLARLGLQQQKAHQQQRQFETKETRAAQQAVDKETLPFYTEINKSAKAAKDNNQRLSRMQELLNKGNLSNPVFYGLSKRIGLNIPAFLTADAQEFNKLSQDFLKSAKDIFGSRLTNYDVNAFLQTVPELSQTDEGKQRIINNLKIFNEGALLRQHAIREVIRNNNGKRPANIEEQVDDIVNPQLEQLSEMFAQGTPLGKSVRSIEDTNQNQGIPSQQEPNSNITPTSSQISGPFRHIGRTGARIAESVLGIPGDIASVSLGAANYLTNKLTGSPIPGSETLQSYLPSSTNLRNVTQALTGKKLEPQSSVEKLSDDIFSDLATFLLPVKGKIPVSSALIKTGLGNAASFIAENIGAGPVGKGIAKVGTVLLSSFLGGRKQLNNIMQQSYTNAENLAGAAKESAKELSTDIRQITKDITTGIKTPGKTFVSDSIRGISDSIKNGKIAVKEAWNLKREANDLIKDLGTPSTAKKYLGRLVQSLNKVLGSYGKQNKEFGEAFHQAEDIYRGIYKASDIAKTIQESVKPESLTNNLIKSLLYGAAFKAPGVLPAAAAGLGAGLGIQSFTKFLQLFRNSPTARKYYLNIAKYAARENPSLIQRNAQLLNNLAEKEGY